MEKIERNIDLAFAALCSMTIKGPIAIPIGSAMDALMTAKREIEQMKTSGAETVGMDPTEKESENASA